MTVPVLSVSGISKTFTTRRDILGRPTERVVAVKDATFDIGPGETLGLVGESGSGKSTTGRLIAQLIRPDEGSVRLDDQELTTMRGRGLRRARRHVQMVFQDPFSSLDPSWVVTNIVTEGLKAQGIVKSRKHREERAEQLLGLVGLSSRHLHRYPYEFSGGQRQRIAIARALALEPRLLVCDEAVSALDVSTQASILTVFEELQRRLGLSYLFISHDLSVVRHVSHRIAVMYLGRIVEVGPSSDVYDQPRHPYTQALLSAIPHVNQNRRGKRIILKGDLPSPADPPAGCVFHTRCPAVMDVCRTEVPNPRQVGNQSVSCHLYPCPPVKTATTTTPPAFEETAEERA
jgi:oligopeptide/dipeptide ABC transporter ATP-binding protein